MSCRSIAESECLRETLLEELKMLLVKSFLPNARLKYYVDVTHPY